MIEKTDKDTIGNYFEDSSNLKGGHADKVVIPENTEELACFIKDANSRKIPVTISGGGTGTVGSRIPFGGVVISMERFNNLSGISCSEMSATLSAGVLVEELKNSAEKKGLFYTSHPTERSASVGGTVATNASGSRSFRYGPTRKHVRRLKMVLPDGEILELRRGQAFFDRKHPAITLSSGRIINIPVPGYKMPDVKTSAGYFWKDGMDPIDLFIGQEGTLSVITEMDIGLVNKPSGVLSCFVFFKKEEDSWGFSDCVKRSQGLDILSIEYFDHNAVEFLRKKSGNLPGEAEAAIFFEQEIGEKEENKLIDDWIKAIVRYGSSADATWVAMNDKDSREFTELRYAVPESINELIKKSGFHKFSTDIAVREDKFSEMMDFYVRALRGESIRHVIFGHIGENHLHVNILPKSSDEFKRAEAISLSFVHKGVSLGGTVSAEHGIGKLKHKYLEEMYGRQGVLDMIRIKKVFDPNCILGRGNIFPS